MRTTSSPPLLLDYASRFPSQPTWLQWPASVDLARHAPDARALDRLGPDLALLKGILPLRPAGAVTPIAASDTEAFQAALLLLERTFGPVAESRIGKRATQEWIERLRAPTLAARATTRTKLRESFRGWSARRVGWAAAIVTIAFVLLALFQPQFLLGVLAAWAAPVAGLRTFATIVSVRYARRLGQTWRSRRPLALQRDGPPTISLLVPLYDEKGIAGRLVKRLGRLDHPHDNPDILLVLEAGNRATESASAKDQLPSWMRIIRAPPRQHRTKPHAMNYALDFAIGDIIGIYDADDAPALDQLIKVVQTFRRSGPETACVQGLLDFYNARQTWLTRCFTIDHATWFRLALPGMVRIGFVIPLGGTTLFLLRREALEKLGRWDAHNVTEDADLGIRLARRGYRVAFVSSVTEEKSTASIPAWIRQRSLWIKGYAMTWAVHIRDPLRLWGELGPWRFLGIQILFLGTLSQFILAPLLWSFWLVLFGFPHPVTAVITHQIIVAMDVMFLISEVDTMGVAALSVATPKDRWLIKWVPVLHLYYPLAAIASWKGYAEMISKPFCWDKTAHGQTTPPEDDRSAPLPRHPA